MNTSPALKVETIGRPLRLPTDLYNLIKKTTEMESSLRPVNSTLVEAITLGLPLVVRRIQRRNRDMARCLSDIAAAEKVTVRAPRGRGNCPRGNPTEPAARRRSAA